jgi:hypothetical protein
MVLTTYLFASWYAIVAGLLFRTWLEHADRDTTMTPNQQRLSWVVLFVATSLWVLTLPLAYRELLKKRSVRASEKPLVRGYFG